METSAGSGPAETSTQEIFEYIPPEDTLASIGNHNRSKNAEKTGSDAIVESSPSVDIDLFETSIVDSSDVDFSGAIASKATGYGINKATESLDAKVARLRLEIEQLDSVGHRDSNELKELLESKTARSGQGDITTTTTTRELHFYSHLGHGGPEENAILAEQSALRTDTGYPYAALSALEARVADLEKRVGFGDISTSSPLSLRMDDIQRRLALLTASPEGLETAVLRLKDLVITVDRLKSAGPNIVEKATSSTQDKINALYNKLGEINEVNEVMPYVVSRLETLRRVHVDATFTTAAISNAESTLEAIRTEMDLWKTSLENLETKLAEHDSIAKGNIKEIERRIEAL